MIDYKEDSFIITYSNHLEFNGILMAFRKKELFNISNTPQHIEQVNINE